jgi:hypothetical protein
MFLEAIQLLLWNFRAEREGNWELHLHTQGVMLPYMFRTNGTNYSRYVPVYTLDMLDLPQSVKSAFEAGQFIVRQTMGHFNGIWVTWV